MSAVSLFFLKHLFQWHKTALKLGSCLLVTLTIAQFLHSPLGMPPYLSVFSKRSTSSQSNPSTIGLVTLGLCDSMQTATLIWSLSDRKFAFQHFSFKMFFGGPAVLQWTMETQRNTAALLGAFLVFFLLPIASRFRRMLISFLNFCYLY